MTIEKQMLEETKKLIGILTSSKAVTFASLFGALLFAIYYYHIGYMPELDLQSASTVLFVAAFGGMLTVLLSSVVFVLPSLVWRWWVVVTGEEKYRDLTFANDYKKNGRKLLFFFGVPVILALSIFFALQYFSGILPALMLFLFLEFLLFFIAIRSKLGWKHILLFVCGWHVSWFFFLLSLLLIITMLSVDMRQHHSAIVYPVIISLYCILLNLLIIKDHDRRASFETDFVRKATKYLAFGFILLLLSQLFSNNWSFIPNKAMRAYRLGDVNVAIVVNDEGKKIVESILPKGSISFEGEKQNKIVELKLLSRLGREYLFCKGDCTVPYKKTDMRFTLPKTAVWSLIWEEKK